MPLVIVIQRAQNCDNSNPKTEIKKSNHKFRIKERGEKKIVQNHTDEGYEDKNNVKSQSGAGGDKEGSDRMYSNHDGGDGDGEKQLNRHDRVYLPNERPPELRTLQHHRIERLRSGLHVRFLKRPLPHLHRREQSQSTALKSVKSK